MGQTQLSEEESNKGKSEVVNIFNSFTDESKDILNKIFGVKWNKGQVITAEIKQKADVLKSVLDKITKEQAKTLKDIGSIAKKILNDVDDVYVENLKRYVRDIELLESNWRTLQLYQEKRAGSENKNLRNLTIVNADLNRLSELDDSVIKSLGDKIEEIYKDKNTVVSKKEKFSYIILPAQNLSVDSYSKYKYFYELILKTVNDQSELAEVKPKDERFVNYNSNACFVVGDLPDIEKEKSESQISYFNRLKEFIDKIDRNKDLYKYAVIYFNQVQFNQLNWNKMSKEQVSSSVDKQLGISASAFALSFAVAQNYDYFLNETGVFSTKEQGTTSLRSPTLRYPNSLHNENRKALKELNISVLNKFDEKTYVESAKVAFYQNVEPGKEALNIPLSSANASMMITKTFDHLQNETLRGNKGFNDQNWRNELKRILNDYLITLTEKGILSNKSENICRKVGEPEDGIAPILLQYKIGSKAEEIDLAIDKPELKVKMAE